MSNQCEQNVYLLAWSVGFIYLPLLVVFIERRPILLQLELSRFYKKIISNLKIS